MENERLVSSTQGDLSIELENVNFEQSNVNLTKSKHILLCEIFKAFTKGITINEIGEYIGAGFSKDMLPLVK